ncbi:MAG: carbon-nitrogen hydrolase [Rhizobiales bacterium]|nr:carbon-nitrogen hydrolase [Hyphomicrobiales bacterium]
MRLAVLQATPVSHGIGEGLARLETAARGAAEAGARVLLTPEMFLSGYAIGAPAVARAGEAIAANGTHERIADLARAHGLTILYGYPAPVAGATGWHNAIRFALPDGTLCVPYAKTHLYGSLDRAQFVAGGTLPPLLELDGWRLAVAICYDIEFPELARAHALAGADAILVPTANMRPFESVPRRLVPARAEENALYVAYANYCGSEGEIVYCGLSCIAGPDGEDVARAGDGDCLLIGAFDRGHLEGKRRNYTHLADRRPELYGPVVAPPSARPRG